MTLRIKRLEEFSELERVLAGPDLPVRNVNLTVEEDIINRSYSSDFNKVILNKSDFAELICSLGNTVRYASSAPDKSLVPDKSLIYLYGPRSLIFVGME
jgi:hypothetical protein